MMNDVVACSSFECKFDNIPTGNGEVYHCIMRKGEPCENEQCMDYCLCLSCKNRDTSFCPKEG